jgi:hypothetical protein
MPNYCSIFSNIKFTEMCTKLLYKLHVVVGGRVVSVLAVGPQDSRDRTRQTAMVFKGDKIRTTPLSEEKQSCCNKVKSSLFLRRQ